MALGFGLGWVGLGPLGSFGGMARLDSTKKFEMIVMININFAIYTSTHYFSPSYAKGHRSYAYLQEKGQLGMDRIDSQLPPGINRPSHTQALR